MIQQRFLPALFEEIGKNNDSSLKFKQILVPWIDKQESEDKIMYTELLKDKNLHDLIYPNEENVQR